ncbi:MAG: Crp/Fnr family transcriptional regulator [Lachnospiraceae bacterium]|nr:Crp/Fnr family transcriptional regulator [Lachnospiraceae bacterium]
MKNNDKKKLTTGNFIDGFALPDYPTRIYGMKQGYELLIDKGEKIHLEANKVFVEPGDQIQYCYMVLNGRVISMEYTIDGSERIYNMFEKGSIFLESNLLMCAPSAISFKTMTETDLVRIEREKLIKSMTNNVNIMLFIMESTTYKYYSAMDQLRENFDHDAAWKVYNMFLILASNFGETDGNWTKIHLKLNQQMLGNLLGMNRVTVSKIIKEMKENGIIQQVNEYYCVRNK